MQCIDELGSLLLNAIQHDEANQEKTVCADVETQAAITQSNALPMSGTASPVGGVISDTMERKKTMARRIVTSEGAE